MGRLELYDCRDERLDHLALSLPSLISKKQAHMATVHATEGLQEARDSQWAYCTGSILVYVAFDNKAKSFQLQAAVLL